MNLDNPVISLAKKAYELLVTVGDLFSNLFLLAFRLNWGIQFMKNGWGKLHNHADIVSFFTDLKIPMPDLNAWMVSYVECIGGVLLILGLATRPIGVILTVTMTVAYLSVEDDRAKVFDMLKSFWPWNPDKQSDFLQADPFFFLLVALLVFCFGPGKISVDYLLGRFLFKKAQNNGKSETSSAG